ncbi:MAG: peptidyl-prolyl cis-trans isomerase [Candidatus Krumholzibacteriota bacterium]
MSPSPVNSQTVRNNRNVRSVPAVVLLTLTSLAVLLAVLSGCGGGGEKDAVLATVGKVEIKAGYYEDRLVRLEEKELPRSADGLALDMSLPEGKQKFLETLINKEIMVQTARNMGLENDPNIAKARETLSAYEASQAMWDKVIQEPASTISPEELEAFYAKMGSSRICQYVICNFKDDAEAARKMAVEGADWEDVVHEYHDGGDPPSGVYEIPVPFGRYNPEFEDGVFNTEIGEITPPITTVYGYWVLKVLQEKPGKKPPLEEAKAQILDVTHVRKLSHLKEDFLKSVEEKFQFTIHEDGLWKCYQGLPVGETLFKEGTQDPRKQDELAPLQIATEDMDLVLYSYMGRDGLQEYTLLDYKIHFDKMSVFQRPKDTEMLGGLRSKIRAELGKTLLNFEAEDRGMFEDPDVMAKVNIKIEEMIVGKLYSEVVQIDEQVTPEDLDAFWADHSQEYFALENRAGRQVICRSEEKAAEAWSQAEKGMAWSEILETYGSDADNKANAGALENVVLKDDNPVSTALFALQAGEVSQPFPLGDGRFGVVMLESIVPQRPVELAEVREPVGQRVRDQRKEQMFQAKLDQWKEDIPVTTFEDRLADLASWEELRTTEIVGEPVARN